MYINKSDKVEHKELYKNRIIEFLLPISIFLSSYFFIGLSLMYWILFIYSIAKMVTCRQIYYINKHLAILVLFVIFHQTLIIGISGSEIRTIVNTILETLLTFYIIVVISNSMKEELVYKPYSVIAIVAMLGIFIHSIQVYVYGMMVTPIQVLPEIFANNLQWLASGYRPMGFFVEPEAYATFILPVLFMSLKKQQFWFSTILTISILLSTSSLGILLSCAVWFWFVIKSKLVMRIKILLSVAFMGVIVLFIQNDLFLLAFNKIADIEVKNSIRLSQGFQIWNQMPAVDRIVGLGRKSLVNYILDNSIWLDSMIGASGPHKWSYVTTISGVLIYYGILGALLFYRLLYKLVADRKSDIFMGVLIIALSFGRTILFNPVFILYYSLYFVFSEKIMNKNYFVLRI